MESVFIENIIDKKELVKNEVSDFNKIFLENNIKQLGEIQEFFVSKVPVMLVNGFLGTGKTSVVNYALSLLKQDVIVLKYNCFETTILDDILLAFFDEFKTLTAKGIIRPTKVKADNFTQKIEAYFSVIEKPVVIVIDSFDSVLKDNKQEILDFIFYLSGRSAVKTLFIARTFDYNDYKDKINYLQTTVLALDKPLFEKFLRSFGIKLIGPVSDELYKYSRGYFFYTLLSLKIITANNLSLIDFIQSFTKSFLSYNDFLLREAFSYVDPISGHLFRLLTIMRHPVSISLLKTMNLYNEERVNFFVENLILSADKDMIYLKDYYKEISQNSIPESVSVKLHRACADLYNTQLPLKPFERDLLISRQTMRSEIEYHSMFLPKRPFIPPVNNNAIESVEYAASSLENLQTAKLDKPETSEDKIKNISFIFDTEEDEKKIMGDIANSINKFIDYSTKTLSDEETLFSLKELLNHAKTEESRYNYNKAAAFYLRALLKKDDADFCTFLPGIYTRLAHCYTVLSDWFNALRYYDLALEFYTSAGDTEKMAAMKLEIANVFYHTFKHDKARAILNDITSMQGVSGEILMKAYLALTDFCRDDLRSAYSFCKKAEALSEFVTDKTVLAEFYFKYAVVCDDLNETELAVNFYKKCIQIEKNNPNLSAAYSNLAIIFEESDYFELAEKYYLKSLELDSEAKNYNGMYISSAKLAQLNRKKSPEKALEYYKQAVNHAVQLKEPFYQLVSLIEYGDFCVFRKEFKEGLRNYFKALPLAKTSSQENLQKIEKRILDVKIRLGEDYKQVEKELLSEK